MIVFANIVFSLLLLTVVGAEISCKERSLRLLSRNQNKHLYKSIHDYPFIVSISIGGIIGRCGGVLYKSNIVITSAKCSKLIFKRVSIGPSSKVYKVQKYIPHTFYNSKNHLNDIAVLVLKENAGEDVGANDEILVELEKRKTPVHTKLKSCRRTSSGHLKCVPLELAKKSKCDYNTKIKLPEKTVCALGEKDEYTEAVSGEPLINKDNKLVGIVSYEPGKLKRVYTEVHHYEKWIKEVVSKYSDQKTNTEEKKKEEKDGEEKGGNEQQEEKKEEEKEEEKDGEEKGAEKQQEEEKEVKEDTDVEP